MGFLKNFFTSALNEQPQVSSTNSFDSLSQEALERHLNVTRYGDFELTDAVRPGDKFEIAVFGINGPISVAPANTVWFREARLEFYR